MVTLFAYSNEETSLSARALSRFLQFSVTFIFNNMIATTILIATGTTVAYVFLRAYFSVRKYRQVLGQIGVPEVPDKGWKGGWSQYTDTNDLFQLERDMVKKYGKVFGLYEGQYPVLVVTELSMLKQIMLKDHEHFYDRRVVFKTRKSVFDFSLILLTGARWKHTRQLITPAFTPANLRRMEPLLKKVCSTMVANIDETVDQNVSFDAKEITSFFAMDAVATIAFALDLDSKQNQDSEFVKNARLMFTVFPFNGKFMTLLLMFPDFMTSLLRKIPLKAIVGDIGKVLVETVTNELDRRKAVGNEQRQDFLNLLIPLEKDPDSEENKEFIKYDEMGSRWLTNGFSRPEIIGQSIMFFLAGYETTSSALAMALYAMALNPTIQEKLYQDLKNHLTDKEMSLETLNEVPYLAMCINEMLRCYSPTLRIDRVCTSDTVVNGFHIPKGVTINIPVNAIHHDPEHWPNPDVFDPERFRDMDSIPPMAFIPFGAGNRNCIGMRLAMLEIKMALATLMLRFKFSMAPEAKIPIRFQPTAIRIPHSETPLKMIAIRR